MTSAGAGLGVDGGSWFGSSTASLRDIWNEDCSGDWGQVLRGDYTTGSRFFWFGFGVKEKDLSHEFSRILTNKKARPGIHHGRAFGGHIFISL
jgi:hypothetical protein